MSKDVYGEVTARIITALDAGVAPWVQPWCSPVGPGGLPKAWPRNGQSGRPYSGINVLLLSLSHYADPRWVTFRQAKSMGGSVRKGARGTEIVFWHLVKKQDTDAEGQVGESTIPMLRTFTVFNAEQCDGLGEIDLVRTVSDGARDTVVRNEMFFAIWDGLAADGCPIGHGGVEASYSPSLDQITLPPADAFVDNRAYLATALHETTHATGHEKRNARAFGRRFGDDAYAFEELVAEIGSAYLCAVAGVEGNLQHASYIDTWIRVLKSDKRAIFTASREAQAAASWLLSHAGLRTWLTDGVIDGPRPT